MHLFGELRGLFRAIAQSHGCQHITLGSDAHTGAPSLAALLVDFLPKGALGALHFVVFGVRIYLLLDALDFLQLQVNDVVHNTLRQGHMLLEEFKVEISVRLERVHHVGVEIDSQQAA